MKIAGTASVGIPERRREIIFRSVVINVLAGLLMGIFEALLLRSSPRVEALLIPDIGRVEWFLAPLLDMACFGLLGLVLGWLASRNPGKRRITLVVAANGAAVLVFVALRIRWLHTRIVIKEFTFRENLLIPLAWYAAAFVASLLVTYLLWKPVSKFVGESRFRWLHPLSWGLGLACT